MYYLCGIFLKRSQKLSCDSGFLKINHLTISGVSIRKNHLLRKSISIKKYNYETKIIDAIVNNVL